MAHAWWHPFGTGPQVGTEEFYDQPGQPDVAAAMDWAQMQAENEGREPTWKDILAYWSTQDPTATPAGVSAGMEARRMGVTQEEASIAGLPSRDITGGYGKRLRERIKEPEKKEKKTTSDLEKLFLFSMLENMAGGDIGQAPAVVAGGGRREFPTMMRQFAPWEREKPYWWIR